MSDFDSVLSAAQQLPDTDRLRLIDALWDSVPPDSDVPFSDEWASEIERRVAELDAGTAQTVPWPGIRDEALARIGHGKAN
jgi:putative addiction module component (TIGR02574 family)